MAYTFFTHEQAQAVADEIRSVVPLEVIVVVSDVMYDGEYRYSLIGFFIEYECICSCNSIENMKAIARFIDLMTGFSYPVRQMERDSSDNIIENAVSYEKYAEPFDPDYIPVD